MKTRKLNLTRSDLLQLIRWGAFIALLVFLLLTVITAKNWLVTLIPASEPTENRRDPFF